MSVRRRFGLRVERHVRRRRGPADDERRGGATERRSKHAATCVEIKFQAPHRNCVRLMSWRLAIELGPNPLIDFHTGANGLAHERRVAPKRQREREGARLDVFADEVT